MIKEVKLQLQINQLGYHQRYTKIWMNSITSNPYKKVIQRNTLKLAMNSRNKRVFEVIQCIKLKISQKLNILKNIHFEIDITVNNHKD